MRYRHKKQLVYFLLGVFPQITIAQNRIITGKVTDLYYFPITGVEVSAYNGTDRTVTDRYGRYRIEISHNTSALAFSKEGLKAEFVDINDKNEINACMRFMPSVEIPDGREFQFRMLALNWKHDPEKSQEIPVTYDQFFRKFNLNPVVENGELFGVMIKGKLCSYFIVDGNEVQVPESTFPYSPEDLLEVRAVGNAGMYGAKGINGAVIIKTRFAGKIEENTEQATHHHQRGHVPLDFTGEKNKKK